MFEDRFPELRGDYNTIPEHHTVILYRQRDTVTIKLLKVYCETRRPWMSEKLADFSYHCVLSVLSFNFCPSHRNCSNTTCECSLEIVLIEDISDDGVIIWNCLSADEARQSLRLTKISSPAVLDFKVVLQLNERPLLESTCWVYRSLLLCT